MIPTEILQAKVFAVPVQMTHQIHINIENHGYTSMYLPLLPQLSIPRLIQHDRPEQHLLQGLQY